MLSLSTKLQLQNPNLCFFGLDDCISLLQPLTELLI